VNLRRATRMPPADVVIELDTPEELFYADPSGLLGGSNRIDSGMDELVERILAQKDPSSDQRIVLDIAGECPEETAATMVAAVHRYCELRQRRSVRELDLIWRQGKRALLNGSFLFVVGIALSYLFTRSWITDLPRDLFGYGVFLVVAWVGLWYPLDMLFIAREQAKREISVLGQMVAMPVVVRAHVGTVAVTAVPRSRTSPGIVASLNHRFRRYRGPSSAARL
jgi:hypothetical protein